jgi:3-oxoacyl-[acyl-carrier protein] reductase
MSQSSEKLQSLQGKTALVTGASGGIGRAVALELARQGAWVFAHGNSNGRALEKLVSDAAGQGADVEFLLCDLSDNAAQDHMLEEIQRRKGSVDILINCAGVDILTGTTVSQTFEEKLEQLLLIDVKATIRLSRLVGEQMKTVGKGGSIVNIGWDGAARGMAGDSAQLFAAAKGAVEAFSRCLAQTLAPDVRVNCVAPGWIRTEWGTEASGYWQERAKAESLMDRWGTPEDVARVVRFLVTDDGSFLSGQTINVNGGFRYSR